VVFSPFCKANGCQRAYLPHFQAIGVSIEQITAAATVKILTYRFFAK
jgi:hypothetical protein